MKCDYKYITFHRAVKQNPKTWIYLVRSKDSKGSSLLGVVKYYAQWRQYGFYPESGTVFEKTCLNDIKDFCIKLNEKQKLRSRKKEILA